MDEDEHLKAQLKEARRELREVYASRSWRAGKRLVRIAEVLRLGGHARRRVRSLPQVRVERWSPSITGCVVFSEAGPKRCDVVLSIDGLDVQSLSIDRDGPQQTVAFEFLYPLDLRPSGGHVIEIRHSGTPSPLRPHDDVVLPPSQRERLASTFLPEWSPVRRSDALSGARSVAILSTYRPPARGLHSLLRLVRSLRDAGIAVVVVDTSEMVPDAHLRVLDDECSLYLRRANVGWDIASWLAALEAMPNLGRSLERLILLNDSNFGPTVPMDDVLNRPWPTGQTPDLWGITDSLQHSPHLQSYFLVLERTALESGLLSAFADRFTFPVGKMSVVLEGEILLSSLAFQRGLTLAARVPYLELHRAFVESFDERLTQIVELDRATGYRLKLGEASHSYGLAFLLAVRDDLRNGVALNPTHHLWDLTLKLGSPFVKRDLIDNNPIPVPWVRELVMDLVPEEIRSDILAEVYPVGAVTAQ